MDRKELVKEFKRNARVANLRLQRLEEYAEESGFSVATAWGYRKAMRDIHKISGENADRFDVTPPTDDRELFLLNQKIMEFLDSPTSTKAGIKRVYIQKADTINERYGTNFTWQELAKFMESETFSKLEGSFTSKTVLRTLGVLQNNVQDLEQKIHEAAEAIQIVGADTSVFNVITALANNGIEVDMEQAEALSNVLSGNLGEYELEDLVDAADVLGVSMPGRSGQTKRNVRKLMRSGEIDWEDVLGDG